MEKKRSSIPGPNLIQNELMIWEEKFKHKRDRPGRKKGLSYRIIHSWGQAKTDQNQEEDELRLVDELTYV
jgi:hypothetical protein